MHPIVVALALSLAGPPAAEPGDPLPDGAVRRIGSPRLRHNWTVGGILFAPDGRTAYTFDFYGVYAWHAADGRRKWVAGTQDWGTGEWLQIQPGGVGVAPSGRPLVVAAGGDPPRLRLVELDPVTGLPAAESAPFAAAEERRGNYIHPAYTLGLPDGGRRVLVAHYVPTAIEGTYRTVMKLYDPAGGAEPVTLGEGDRLAAVVTAGGRRVAVADRTVIRLFDGRTGRPTGEERRLDPARHEAVLASDPGGRWLLLGRAAGRDAAGCEVVRWEPATGLARTLYWAGSWGHAGHFVDVRPDGRRVLVSGSGGCVERDADTGAVARRLPADVWAGFGRYSPDGRTVWASDGHSDVRVWDAAAWTPANPPAAVPGTPVALQFARADRLIGVSAGRVIAWDVATGRELSRGPPLPYTTPDFAAVAVSPDGTRAAVRNTSPGYGLYEADTGRRIAPLALPVGDTVAGDGTERPAEANALLFSADGRRVFTASREGTLAEHDGSTGRLLRTFGPIACDGQAVAVSADGRWLAGAADVAAGVPAAVPNNIPVRIWDLTTGAVARSVTPDEAGVVAVAFSPDGRELYTAGGYGGAGNGVLAAWDVRTGARLRSATDMPAGLWRVEATPDGRHLIAIRADGTQVYLIDRRTLGVRRVFGRHRGRICAVAIRGDGRRFATASPDAPIYLWDVYAPPAGGPLPLDVAWAKLGDADPAVGFAAVTSLIHAGPAGVRLIGERVRPVPVPAAADVDRWLAELDGPRFADRDRAAAALTAVADAIPGRLEAAAKATASADARAAIGRMLDAVARPAGDRLRAVRAVEVLRVVGTPEADAVRAKLAAGAAGARLTVEVGGR